MDCNKCKMPLGYLGSTKDGDTVTDYYMCIKGHKKKMRISYRPSIEDFVQWREVPPF